jgi:hypothetical protein
MTEYNPHSEMIEFPVYPINIVKKLRKKYTYLDDKLIIYENYDPEIRFLAHNDKKIFKFIGKIGEGADGEVCNAKESLVKKKGFIPQPTKKSKVVTIKIVPIKFYGVDEELSILRFLRKYQEDTNNFIFPYLITNCVCHNMYPEYYTNSLIKQNFYKNDFIEQLKDYLNDNKKEKIDTEKFCNFIKCVKYTDNAHIYVMNYVGVPLKMFMDVRDKNMLMSFYLIRDILPHLYLMAKIGIYHLDLHLNNIIVCRDDEATLNIEGKIFKLKEHHSLSYKIIDFSRGTHFTSPLFEKKIKIFYKKFFPDLYLSKKKDLMDAIKDKENRYRFNSIDAWRLFMSMKSYLQNRYETSPEFLDVYLKICENDIKKNIFTKEGPAFAQRINAFSKKDIKQRKKIKETKISNKNMEKIKETNTLNENIENKK